MSCHMLHPRDVFVEGRLTSGCGAVRHLIITHSANDNAVATSVNNNATFPQSRRVVRMALRDGGIDDSGH